jgi:para-nitrobenzyl esterase
MLALVALAALVALVAPALGSVQVATVGGLVRGQLERSSRGATDYAIFYGVPYARPPTGSRRFLPPQPVEPWQGVFDNRRSMSAVCLQRDAMAWEAPSEDCLYLTLATPAVEAGAVAANASLPVMVWLHGGGWVWGSGNPVMFNPDYFMDEAVVHISINYRLGALGFLSLPGEAAAGNQALRDQQAALRWVQDNARAFGGDPGQVTLFGQSAGSCSLFLLSVSPLSTGLLHRAIAQSGGNLGPGMGNNPKSEEKAFELGGRLAGRLGCSGPGPLLPCLQALPDGLAILDADDYGPYANLDPSLGPEAFLPETPRSLLQSGAGPPLDLVLGFNRDEGLHVIIDLLMQPDNDTNFELVRDAWDTVGPYMLFDQHEDEVTEEVVALAHTVAEFYLGPRGIASYDRGHLQGIVDMYSDAW